MRSESPVLSMVSSTPALANIPAGSSWGSRKSQAARDIESYMQLPANAGWVEMVEQCRADIHITKIGEMYVQNRRAIEGIRIIEHTVIRGECFSATVEQMPVRPSGLIGRFLLIQYV